MIRLMKLKYLLTVPLTISLAVFISACNQPSNSVPIQSDSGHSDEYSDGYQYQNTPPLTNTEASAVGAVGVATGYAVGKYVNKPKASYSKPNNGYGKPVVVVNKYYYQTKPKVRVSRYKRK